jgi:hypothetical protein
MESQVIPAHTCSCTLPGDLQDIGSKGHTSTSKEDKAVGSGTSEAIHVLTYVLVD